MVHFLWRLFIFWRFFSIFNEFSLNFIVDFMLLTFVDALLLFITKEPIKAQRILPEKLSNGDENFVKIDIKNLYGFNIKTKIIDEIPFQFQKEIF
jgi:hypothetical protein